MASWFPNVSFDWLGELPDIAEKSRLRSARREALADLDTTDVPSMERKAAALLRAGDIETGLKLQQAALARRTLAQRGAEQDYYRTMVMPLLLKQQGAPALPATAEGGPDFDPLNWGGPAAPPAPAVPQYNWPTPGPQSALPQNLPSAAAGPQEAPLGIPPPTGPLAGPPPIPPSMGPLAGPPPGPVEPPTAPAPAAPPPEWLPGVPPGGMTPTPIAPAAPPAQPRPQGTDPQTALRQRAADLTRELTIIGKGPAAQARQAELREILGRLKMTNTQQEYVFDNIQRKRAGEPTVSFDEWKREEKVLEPTYKEAIDASKVFTTEGDKARGLQQTLRTMQSIMNNPKFFSGGMPIRNLPDFGAPIVQRAASIASGLRGMLKTFGVPEERLPDISRITDTASLLESFNALRNQAVVATLGGLGNQVSNPDRDYIDAAFPNLQMTDEGNKLLVELMSKVADHKVAVSNVVDTYRSERKTRATAQGVRQAVDKYNNEHGIIFGKDGKLTDLGKRLQGELDRIDSRGGGGGEATPPPAAAPAGGGRPAYDAKGNMYRWNGENWVDEKGRVFGAQ